MINENLVITYDAMSADAITHSGVFHADEVMATAILSGVKEKLTVARDFRVPEGYPGIAYDIGGGEFDHHQKGGNGVRENGTPYASAGLVWKKYGPELLKKYGVCHVEEGLRKIDRVLMETIDGIDNGHEFGDNGRVYSICSMITSMNPTWQKDMEPNTAFVKAVDLAYAILEREIEVEKSRQEAGEIIIKAVEEASGGIMELDTYVPWKEFLEGNSEAAGIDYVIFPSVREGFNVQAVPPDGHPMEQKKPFPENWRGKKGEELVGATGLEGSVFAHAGGFLCVAETRETARMLARISESGCSAYEEYKKKNGIG